MKVHPLPNIQRGLREQPVSTEQIQLKKWLRRLTTTAVASFVSAAVLVGYLALRLHDQVVSNLVAQVREQTVEEIKDAALQQTKANFLADSKQVNTTCYNWWFNTKRN